MKRQTDIITVTRLGHTFKASRRTVAWLDWLVVEFNRLYPNARLVLIQACYNTSVQASAGTHDKDAAVDLGFTGTLTPHASPESQWRRFEGFIRNHRAGGWWRHTGTWASRSAWHVHCFPLPVGLKAFKTLVGQFIDGGASMRASGQRAIASSSQLDDYLNGRDGLVGHAPDHGWRPQKLKAFNYSHWVLRNGIPRGKGEK